MPPRRDAGLLEPDLTNEWKPRAVGAIGVLLEPGVIVLLPGAIENVDRGVRRPAHAAPLPEVVPHLLIGGGDGALEGADSMHNLLGAEAARHAVLAGGEKIVVAAGEKAGGIDLIQVLNAALADERNVAVLVVAAVGAAVVLEFGAAERAVVARGLDQLPELALELAALLAAHELPSTSCQRPHTVL